MIISLHPIVDQLVQWMDVQICRKKRAYHQIPFDTRLYAALRGARYRIGLSRKKDMEAGIERWDPTSKTWDLAQASKIGRRRHLLLTRVGLTSSESAMVPNYLNSFGSSMTDEFLDDCFDEVGVVIHLICEGQADIVGWDDNGRMELKVSSCGAECLGSRPGARVVVTWAH